MNKLYPLNKEGLRVGRGNICEIKIDDINAYIDEVHAFVKRKMKTISSMTITVSMVSGYLIWEAMSECKSIS